MENNKTSFVRKEWFFWVCVLFFPPAAIILDLKFNHCKSNKILRIVVMAYCCMMTLAALVASIFDLITGKGTEPVSDTQDPPAVVEPSEPDPVPVPEPQIPEPEEPKQEEPVQAEVKEPEVTPEPVSPYTEEEQALMNEYNTANLEFAKACRDNPNAFLYRIFDGDGALITIDVLDFQKSSVIDNDSRDSVKIKFKVSLIASESENLMVMFTNDLFAVECTNSSVGLGDRTYKPENTEEVFGYLIEPGEYKIGTLFYQAASGFNTYKLVFDKRLNVPIQG